MIRIICVGKIKEDYIKSGILDYVKRINKYHKLEVVELMDSNINEERDRIFRYINKKDYNISLDIEGNELTSLEFAKKIESTFISYANINFIIGGSDGLHSDIKTLCNYSLSFSKFTFPHQLFRMILLEQIYRAFKIINNETYHK